MPRRVWILRNKGLVTLEAGMREADQDRDSNLAIDERRSTSSHRASRLDYNLDNGGTLYAIYARHVKPGGLERRRWGLAVKPAVLNKQKSQTIFRTRYQDPCFHCFPRRLQFHRFGLLPQGNDVQLTTANWARRSGALTSIAPNQGAGEFWASNSDLAVPSMKTGPQALPMPWTGTPNSPKGRDADE